MSHEKILIVDDESGIRRLIRRQLESHGYEIHDAENADLAIRLANINQYDVIVTDLNMPGMGGEELLHEIFKVQPLIRSIVLTGYGSLESAMQVISSGCDEYLLKPLENLELINLAVKKCLAKRACIYEQILYKAQNDMKTKFILNTVENIIQPAHKLEDAINLMMECINDENYGDISDFQDDINKFKTQLLTQLGQLIGKIEKHKNEEIEVLK